MLLLERRDGRKCSGSNGLGVFGQVLCGESQTYDNKGFFGLIVILIEILSGLMLIPMYFSTHFLNILLFIGLLCLIHHGQYSLQSLCHILKKSSTSSILLYDIVLTLHSWVIDPGC